MENPHKTQTPLVQESSVSHSNKSPSLPMLLSGVVLVTALVAGGIGYYLGSMQKSRTVSPDQEVQVTTIPESIQVACTMEAKLCPDGSSVGRSGPNCEFAQCPTVLSTSQFIIAKDVTKSDKSGNVIPQSQGNIYMTLPAQATSVGKNVTFNNVTYDIATNLTAGLCPMEATEQECTYNDEKIEKANSLRVWKDQKGIFALNLVTVNVNDYYLDSIVVTKRGDKSFSGAEISQWKEIFRTLNSESVKN